MLSTIYNFLFTPNGLLVVSIFMFGLSFVFLKDLKRIEKGIDNDEF